MPPDRVKTSFIPKASLKVERRQKSGGSVGLINLIATVILIVAVVATGGTLLFEQLTARNIEAKRVSLERARAAFEPATIKELSRLDKRLDASERLLNSHIELSHLLDEIETQTLTSVRFGNFSFGNDRLEGATLSMSGEARSFNALALQADAFGSSDFFIDPIFSNFNIDQSGVVLFNFTATVDQNQLGYVARAAAPTPSPSPSPAPEPEETPTEEEKPETTP
jgi:hypothetical protein